MVAVRAIDLSKSYVPINGIRDRFRALFGLGLPDPKSARRALEPISFTLEGGESIGLIGSNGSGKSTLLKLLAGVSVPSTGRTEISGRVSALLELGTGFHPDFSGRENILHAGLLAGLSRREIKRLEPEIVAFAELEHAINNPLRTYSSGMQMRLGFSVAHAVRPEILLIDEVLAVGDAAFRVKCFERLREFCASGGTFILVSHDLSNILRLCRRSIWLERGKLEMDGPSREVGEAYQNRVMQIEDARIEKQLAGLPKHQGLALKLARHQIRPNDPLAIEIRFELSAPLVKAELRLFARKRDHVCLLELRSGPLDFAAGAQVVVADLGTHRLGPAELYWSAVLECEGRTIAAFGEPGSNTDPVPMGIVGRPNDALERGGLRQTATWSLVTGL